MGGLNARNLKTAFTGVMCLTTTSCFNGTLNWDFASSSPTTQLVFTTPYSSSGTYSSSSTLPTMNINVEDLSGNLITSSNYLVSVYLYTDSVCSSPANVNANPPANQPQNFVGAATSSNGVASVNIGGNEGGGVKGCDTNPPPSGYYYFQSTASGDSSSGTINSVCSPAAYLQQASGPAVNLLVPIELLDAGASSPIGSGAYPFQKSLTSLSPSLYQSSNGTTYYFEVMASNSDSSSRNVALVNNTTGTVQASVSIPASNLAGVSRYVAPFLSKGQPFTTDPGQYLVQLDKTTSLNQLTVLSARILVQQCGATATQLVIPMTQGNAKASSSFYDTATAALDSTGAATWTQNAPANYYVWNYSLSANSTITGFNLEGVISASASTSGAFLGLENMSGGLIASFPGNTVGTTPTLVSTSISAASLTSGTKYEYKITNTAGSTTYLYKSNLRINVSPVTNAEVYYRIATASSSISTSGQVNVGEMVGLDSNTFSNPVYYLEALAFSTISGAVLTLYDLTTAGDTSGYITIPTLAGYPYRSTSSVTLGGTDTYGLDIQTNGATGITLSAGFLVIDVH